MEGQGFDFGGLMDALTKGVDLYGKMRAYRNADVALNDDGEVYTPGKVAPGVTATGTASILPVVLVGGVVVLVAVLLLKD